MKQYERLPKGLPVPVFLDEKILRHAADFAERRRRHFIRRRIFISAAASAAAVMIATLVLLPEPRRNQPQIAAKNDVPEWSVLDQESYVLCAEINTLEEDFSI